MAGLQLHLLKAKLQFSLKIVTFFSNKSVLLQDVHPLETFSDISVPCSWGTALELSHVFIVSF